MTAEGHNRIAPIFPKRPGTVQKATKCGSISLLQAWSLPSEDPDFLSNETRNYFIAFPDLPLDLSTEALQQLNVDPFALLLTDLTVQFSNLYNCLYRNVGCVE